MQAWENRLMQDEQLLEWIWEATAKQIESLEHRDKFLRSFTAVCAQKGSPAVWDFLEVFDSDPPEYLSFQEDAPSTFRVQAEMNYGLSVWNEGEQLGKVTATVQGTYTFKLADPVSGLPVDITGSAGLSSLPYEIKVLEIEELHNVEDYYDDYTMLNF
ncbi:hypothetical protein GCM10010912_54820 [Paenibacillus albidus]|uniref:Uncharacterized protein n=1 Tax=Paenibacillus albidus TaxID=2041023 RepID=A0A917FU53_9BACL|nr:hypothetical protein [Paenibacillus albidus]GGG03115.1 hypothetical protein GCM10010912_54820 [Paenibacillus albidus]